MTTPDLDDLDNPEWTAEDFQRARPAAEVFGARFADVLSRLPSPVSSVTRQGGVATTRRLAA